MLKCTFDIDKQPKVKDNTEANNQNSNNQKTKPPTKPKINSLNYITKSKYTSNLSPINAKKLK